MSFDVLRIECFIVINIITFFAYGIDKRRAIHNKWRIPEKTLLFLMVISGVFGAGLGMLVFHHKTRKPKFIITAAVCAVIYLVLLGLQFCIL